MTTKVHIAKNFIRKHYAWLLDVRSRNCLTNSGLSDYLRDTYKVIITGKTLGEYFAQVKAEFKQKGIDPTSTNAAPGASQATTPIGVNALLPVVAVSSPVAVSGGGGMADVATHVVNKASLEVAPVSKPVDTAKPQAGGVEPKSNHVRDVLQAADSFADRKRHLDENI
jgi:hypothetical protein